MNKPFLALAAALCLLPCLAQAQTVYTVTPSTIREVEKVVAAKGDPAVITCQPGAYGAFLRYGRFKAPTVLKCAGASFPAASLSYPTNLTLEGGTFTGRLAVADFKNVALRGLNFPDGHGVLARRGTDLTVEGLTIYRSGAAITVSQATRVLIQNNQIHDFVGNAAISAYYGGDVRIIGNTVTNWREAAEGVHPDLIQTAYGMSGTVEISYNTVIGNAQGIFSGGTAERFIARGNYIEVDFPNALTWKSVEPAIVEGNIIRKRASPRTHTPRMFNFGVREGRAVAAPGGLNDVLGSQVEAR
jgi:hypothetical protein